MNMNTNRALIQAIMDRSFQTPKIVSCNYCDRSIPRDEDRICSWCGFVHCGRCSKTEYRFTLCEVGPTERICLSCVRLEGERRANGKQWKGGPWKGGSWKGNSNSNRNRR